MQDILRASVEIKHKNRPTNDLLKDLDKNVKLKEIIMLLMSVHAIFYWNYTLLYHFQL